VTFNNLSAILRAFRQDEDVSILSTPQILATDNEEARINISRNIPFQTSTSTEQNETFNSFEYRDVGTVLTVTPHIGRKEQIRIDFNLELSAVQSTVDFRPTTLHRTLNNSVLLRSGQTLVIGGIVEESRNDNQRKVPFLGDQPATGPLFRIDADQSRSSRFFVFLTPRIVRNPLQAAVQAPETDPAASRDIRPPVSP
jgi:general secretion pathway protein D